MKVQILHSRSPDWAASQPRDSQRTLQANTVESSHSRPTLQKTHPAEASLQTKALDPVHHVGSPLLSSGCSRHLI